MIRLISGLVAVAIVAASTATIAQAEDQVFSLPNIQASAPVGITIMVKKITVGEDATVVNLVASFDSRQTGRVNLNDTNAYLKIGTEQKLHLRQPRDNHYLAIQNGQSLEGDLVFPGRIPADAKAVTLVFNEGNSGDDTSAPGLTLDIALPGRP